MSAERAVEFLAEAGQNSSLQERLQQVKTPEDVLQIAREQGYEISAEDMQVATQAVNSSEELSEEDLEAVAGGISFGAIAGAISTGVAVVDFINRNKGTIKRGVDFFRGLF